MKMVIRVTASFLIVVVAAVFVFNLQLSSAATVVSEITAVEDVTQMP